MSDETDGLKQRLRADLKTAMLARDTARTSVVRALLAALDNAQAVPVDLSGPASAQRQFGDGDGEIARLALSAADLSALLEREAAEREDAAREMARIGRADEAARLKAEAGVVRHYLA